MAEINADFCKIQDLLFFVNFANMKKILKRKNYEQSDYFNGNVFR